MGLFSSSGPLREPNEFSTKVLGPRPAAPSDSARFATTPLVHPPGHGASSALTGPARGASSRPLDPDAPTPAVPLSSLLDEAQRDNLWNSGDSIIKAAPEAIDQEFTLYRLAIDGSNLSYEQAFTILALTVEFFHKGDHIERVEQQALRTAAGVILRTQGLIADEALRILAPFYLQQLRSIFQAWHVYRELVKAIDNRSDFLVRMRGRTDQLIIESLFSEEGRSMLAARVEAFAQSCERLQLQDAEALKRAEWIGKLLMYKTDTGWQVPPEGCIGLCTRLLREINDDSVMGQMRRLAAQSWEGLCRETNFLRDLYADADATPEDKARGVILIRTEVPTVGLPVIEQQEVLYFPDHNSFRTPEKKDKGSRLLL